MVPVTQHRVPCVVQVRDLFAKAEAAAPCILFFDEAGKCVCCCVCMCSCAYVYVCVYVCVCRRRIIFLPTVLRLVLVAVRCGGAKARQWLNWCNRPSCQSATYVSGRRRV